MAFRICDIIQAVVAVNTVQRGAGVQVDNDNRYDWSIWRKLAEK